ncbi:hypothetical protein BB560_001233 [Smittium megazygosporum]|uniref:C2H2-type domain-containing protein n=1 Tax=Smittium megazygosporum TaxID=133381 RepID=A0A2T9ZI59_9FUNG|nr:hypothetical protein BB560_001233 [Smittium megazygosporum]
MNLEQTTSVLNLDKNLNVPQQLSEFESTNKSISSDTHLSLMDLGEEQQSQPLYQLGPSSFEYNNTTHYPTSSSALSGKSHSFVNPSYITQNPNQTLYTNSNTSQTDRHGHDMIVATSSTSNSAKPHRNFTAPISKIPHSFINSPVKPSDTSISRRSSFKHNSLNAQTNTSLAQKLISQETHTPHTSSKNQIPFNNSPGALQKIQSYSRLDNYDLPSTSTFPNQNFYLNNPNSLTNDLHTYRPNLISTPIANNQTTHSQLTSNRVMESPSHYIQQNSTPVNNGAFAQAPISGNRVYNTPIDNSRAGTAYTPQNSYTQINILNPRNSMTPIPRNMISSCTSTTHQGEVISSSENLDIFSTNNRFSVPFPNILNETSPTRRSPSTNRCPEFYHNDQNNYYESINNNGNNNFYPVNPNHALSHDISRDQFFRRQSEPISINTNIPTNCNPSLPPDYGNYHKQFVVRNVPQPNTNVRAHSSTQKKRYLCGYCLKYFTRPSTLKTHIYSHTGERPFYCNYEGCGKRFSVMSNLKRHEKIHFKSKSLPKI